MPLSRMLRQRGAVVKQAFFRLGSGDLFDLGPAPELIGTTAPALSIGIRPGTSATVENGDALEHVDPRGQEVPAFIAGELEGVKPGASIAVTVNGTVEATGRAFLFNGELQYGAVVPLELLRRRAKPDRGLRGRPRQRPHPAGRQLGAAGAAAAAARW